MQARHPVANRRDIVIGALIECRDANVTSIQANEDNVRIIESELAFARRALERMKVAA